MFERSERMDKAITPLRRLNGGIFDQFTAYIKDESFNRYGTVKDRRNRSILSDAMRLGVDKLVLITAGSNGYSLAKLAGDDLKVVTIIDRSLPTSIKQKLEETVYQVIEINLQHKILRPEEVISFAREREDEVIWDVTNGYEDSYASIVAELRGLDPDYIVVPVGSGGVYVGIIEAVQRYKMKTKVIGIGVQNTLKSYADKLHTPWTPYAKVMSRFHHLGHPIYRLTESEVKEAWQQFQHTVELEPSSAVVFAAINKHHFKPTDSVVFLNSGRLNLAITPAAAYNKEKRGTPWPTANNSHL
jgi:cysteine synthase